MTMGIRLQYFAWVVVFLCLLTRVQGLPAGGAVPPGVGEIKTTVACEDQKAYIVCPNIYNAVDILSAMFGRKDAMVCLPPGDDPATRCSEQEDQIKQQVKDLCQGENRCEVSASNDFLAMEGTVVCPNIRKYLEVKYKCMPKTSIDEDEGEITANAVTEIVGGPSSSSSSSLSSSSLSSFVDVSNNAEAAVSSSASASASASASSSLSSSSPASEVQVLLDSEPSTRSESNVVEEIGDQSHQSSLSSQEVTESMLMENAEKSAMRKVFQPDFVKETIIKKSKIERVSPEVTENEFEEEEEEGSGSGMDDMDQGEDEESGDRYENIQE